MIALIQSLRLPARDVVDSLRALCVQSAARRGFVSLADQVIVSGTSFLTTIILGRTCLPEELGLYSVGFSLTVALMGVPRALIWVPYTTFSPAMAEDDRRWYSGSTLAHQMLLCAVTAAIISAIGALLRFLGGTQDLGWLLVVLGPAVALMSLREHVRRVCFSRLHVGQALAIDVAVAGLQTGGMLLLAASGTLTAVRAYMIIGLACFPIVVAWIFATRYTMAVRCDRIVVDLSKNWIYARWIFASALPHAANDALYPWALTWLQGAASVGMLSAATSAIFLTNPLILGLGNFFGPHAAHTYADHGLYGLHSLVMKAWVPLMLFMSAFTLVMAIWGGELVTLIFGGAYEGQGRVVTTLALGQLCDVVTIPLSMGLLTISRGDILLKGFLIRMILSATVGLWCIHSFDAAGVGYGQVVSNLGGGAWQWFAFRSLVRKWGGAQA